MNPASAKTAKIAAEFIKQAQKLLADQPKANGLTLRGFSARPAYRRSKKSTACARRDRGLSDV